MMLAHAVEGRAKRVKCLPHTVSALKELSLELALPTHAFKLQLKHTPVLQLHSYYTIHNYILVIHDNDHACNATS